MKILFIVLLLAGAGLLAQSSAQAQTTVDVTTGSTSTLSVDSVQAIALTLLNIKSGASLTLTIADNAVSTKTASATLTANGAQFAPQVDGSLAVGLKLTKTSFFLFKPGGSGTGTAAFSTSEWKFPLRVEIKYKETGAGAVEKTNTLTFFKAMPPTGAILFDAARLDSLRKAKDPALYTFLEQYDKNVKDKSKSNLVRYFDEDVDVDVAGTKVKLKRNPYLKAFFERPDVPERNDGEVGARASLAPDETAGGASKGAFNLGGLSDPMVAADALATFIARRFKEEVNVAFLNEFRRKLEIDTTLGLVFPRTKDILLAIDPYQYTTFLESMKTAFREDFEKLPDNSATLLDTLVARKTIRPEHSDRAVLGRVALRTLQRTLDNGNNYWGGLRAIDSAAVGGLSENKKTVLLTGSLLLNSLLDSDDRVRLPSAKVLGDSGVKNLIFGLMLARYDTLTRNIRFDFTAANKPDDYLRHALNDTSFVDSTAAKNLIKAFSGLAQATAMFEATLKKIRDQKKKEASSNPLAAPTVIVTTGGKSNDQTRLLSYTDFALRLTGVMDQMLATEKVFPALGKKFGGQLIAFRMRVLTPVRDGIFAFKHIQEKNYALAVVYTANLLVALTSPRDSVDSRTTAALKKYGTFMTSVVAAESRDQMLEALETAALPVGSYRIKRNNFFSAALNTYGGGTIGFESIRGDAELDGSKRAGFLLAPFAPLGVSLAWGRNADFVDKKDHGSFGLHLNLIDVGALAAVRVQDENVTLPEFTWKNLLAPGAYLIYGFRKSVWTLAAGVQLGPELRKVDLKSSANVLDAKAWRAGITLSADIPVFNIFTQANHRRIRTLKKPKDKKSLLLIEAGKNGPK